jgi:hypothetical protein
MGHLTFIHGIGNKPVAEALLDQWRLAVLDNDGLDLDEAGVSMSLVYWADMLYPQPLSEAAAEESTLADLEQSATSADADLSWLYDVPREQRELVVSLGLKMGLDPLAPDAPEDAEVVAGSALEAIPLPPFLKKRLMKVLLRDVHHYVYDVVSTPRRGASFRLRQEIRRVAMHTLREAEARPGPHVVVAHSLGTVIAYDALTVDAAPPPTIDALVTIGSPLGLSEIQSSLSPPWSRHDGWPERSLRSGRWWNVSDRLDPVCGADPSIADEYQRAGVSVVNDVVVRNAGAWRHGITKYLGQRTVREIIRNELGRDLFG